MIRWGIIRAYVAGTNVATVQLYGSASTTIDVESAANILDADVTVGRKCAVVFLDESNPNAAVLFAVWD
jgi:hypothetical protein